MHSVTDGTDRQSVFYDLIDGAVKLRGKVRPG